MNTERNVVLDAVALCHNDYYVAVLICTASLTQSLVYSCIAPFFPMEVFGRIFTDPFAFGRKNPRLFATHQCSESGHIAILVMRLRLSKRAEDPTELQLGYQALSS